MSLNLSAQAGSAKENVKDSARNVRDSTQRTADKSDDKVRYAADQANHMRHSLRECSLNFLLLLLRR